jgi:hypothetical protein
VSKDLTASRFTHTSKLAELAFLKWVAPRAPWIIPKIGQVSSRTMGSRYCRIMGRRYCRTSRIVSRQSQSQHLPAIILCRKRLSWARSSLNRMSWRRCWWLSSISQTTHLKNQRILQSNSLTILWSRDPMSKCLL